MVMEHVTVQQNMHIPATCCYIFKYIIYLMTQLHISIDLQKPKQFMPVWKWSSISFFQLNNSMVQILLLWDSNIHYHIPISFNFNKSNFTVLYS